jgi:hypothetical protein
LALLQNSQTITCGAKRAKCVTKQWRVEAMGLTVILTAIDVHAQSLPETLMKRNI